MTSRTRLFITGPLHPGAPVMLDADRAHYLGRVLRLKLDDRLTVFDGSGAEFAARITEFSRNAARLDVADRVERDVESPLDLRLAQGVSRGERMDIVMQKATELGVRDVVPVITERTVVRLSGERAGKRREHWQRIAVSACEQCGRNRLPGIRMPVALDAFLADTTERSLRLVLAPGAGSRLAEFDRPDGGIDVVAGPEGGLSDDELARCRDAGLLPVSMGPRILRSETAGIAVLAAMQAMWGDG